MSTSFRAFLTSSLAYLVITIIAFSLAYFQVTSTYYAEVLVLFFLMVVIQIITYILITRNTKHWQFPFWGSIVIAFVGAYISHEIRSVVIFVIVAIYSFVMGIVDFKYLFRTGIFCTSLYIFGILAIYILQIEPINLKRELFATFIFFVIIFFTSLMGMRIWKQKKRIRLAYSEIEQKNEQLEGLASKLAKYLSPQVYNSIFSGKKEVKIETNRKRLTIFFSDIKGFTSTTDSMESEALANLLNSYLTEMAEIALR